ncbi:MAG: hypothetical protein UEK58_03595, partial [Merdibacter sp.]|nr:hypothetical protein [Merdibacter sp.]
YLYEDKIILTFNYKDGSKTITLAEVEGSDLSVLGAPFVDWFLIFLKKTETFFCSMPCFLIQLQEHLIQNIKFACLSE